MSTAERRSQRMDNGPSSSGSFPKIEPAQDSARVSGEWLGTGWPNTPVAMIMTRNPMCVGPATSALEARDLMIEQKIGALPVLENETGRVVGVITKSDLLRSAGRVSDALNAENDGWGAVVDRRLAELGAGYQADHDDLGSVGELMTPFVKTVHENTPVAEAAQLMVRAHVHQLVVTSEDGHRTVGVVAMGDILRWLLGQGTLNVRSANLPDADEDLGGA